MGKRLNEEKKRKYNRPILVKLSSIEEKWRIIKKAKNLKNAGYGLERVGITLDLNEKERENRKQMYEELKDRRYNGEEVVIYKGEIRNKNSF